MTRTATTEQPGLFPEPAHTDAEPAAPRYTVHNPFCDDQDHNELHHLCDGEQPDEFPADSGDTLKQLAENCILDDEQWLHDTLTDTWFEPGNWPETDEARAIDLHRVALAELGR